MLCFILKIVTYFCIIWLIINIFLNKRNIQYQYILQYLKMYLDKSQKNRYTIGKVLRKLKNLRKNDPNAKIVPMPNQLQEYYDELIAHGLQVKNLKFALFETKNGLKYPGLIAEEKINTNTILVKVPVDLLLTTRDAFLSDIEKIFVENPGFYAKRFTSEWQDRIILTFLLYQYQKGKNSKWYNLIRNLPRDIDYAIFWNKDQIQYLEDQWMGKYIQSQKEKFEEECGELIKILKNYPEFFNPQTISRENIIWLSTHLVTRCFGKYFEYTTMVPFAQLFNHECVDVYYTMYYKPGNPYDEKQQFYEEKQLTEQELDECQSSDGSYDADDFTYDHEFIESNSEQGWEIDPIKYGEEVVKDIRSILYHMYTFINFSDSISLTYISQVLRELLGAVYIESWEARKKKCQEIHSLNVHYIRKVKEFYKKIKRNYYTYSITQKQKAIPEKPPDIPEQGVNYFEQQWPKDKFDEFYMLCSTKDQFQKGSQVYFCYGRLPNKLLLMRYGIAVEHNKYDHMFIKINIQQQVKHDERLMNLLKDIQIKRCKRFKIKRTKICVQLITYFRIQRWRYGDSLDNIFSVISPDTEIEVLYEVKEFYWNLLIKYKNKLHKNEEELTNKSLGYHKYFALVYKVEQQRILTQQLKMIDYAIEVLVELKKGTTLKDILSAQKSPQRLTYQIMMETYFRMFEITLF